MEEKQEASEPSRTTGPLNSSQIREHIGRCKQLMLKIFQSSHLDLPDEVRLAWTEGGKGKPFR